MSGDIIVGGLADTARATVNDVTGQAVQFAQSMNPLNSILPQASGILGQGMTRFAGPPYPNPLNTYASYNYIFTLSPLSNNEINYPDSTYRISEPSRVVLRSGGSGNLKITSDQENQIGITTDLYIDDVEIYSLVGPNPNTRVSTAVTVNFSVTEPYSMGMFLESLAKAAISKGHAHHVGAPFLLTVDFIGWDDYGNLLKIPNLRRMFPIRIMDTNFSVDNSGSRYQVSCISWQDQGFSDNTQTTKERLSLYGETINEMLQTGPLSLASLLNHREQMLVENGKKKTANEFVILFPKERASGVTSNSTQNSATTSSSSSDDIAVRNLFGANDVTDPSGDVDSESKKIKGFELKTGTIGDDFRSFAENDSNINEIGLSKISKKTIISGETYFNRAAFVENEDSPGTFQRDKILTNKDGTLLIFEDGQRITDIIEEVVMLSEYGRQYMSQDEDSNGMKTWFRVESEVYVGDPADGEKTTGNEPKVYVYKVIPYKVSSADHKNPAKKASGIQSLKNQVIKEYNYIYTGKNDSIIDFNIEINYAYLAAIQYGFMNKEGYKLPDQRIEDPGNDDPDVELQTGDEHAPEGASTVADTSAPNTGGAGGTSIHNSLESQMSRNFSDMITNGVDLIQVDLTIWGDPYFISDTGVGNYTANSTGLINLTSDGTMDYQYSQVDVGLNFRTPVDYDQNGNMIFPNDNTYIFNGLYQVLSVTSKFSKGQFTQELNMIRRHNQIQSPGGSGKTEVVAESG